MSLWDHPRWNGIERPYTEDDVNKLRGSLPVEHTLAKAGANELWRSLQNSKYIHALGALTGNQAVQQVRAGLKAIYCSGWQVAADANLSGATYPDQSLYPANSVPQLVKRINSALQRADQIEYAEGACSRNWFMPIIADAEAGFGGPLNAFELMKQMIDAGVAGVHYEDQLSSAKKCGHLGGKVLVPTSQFIKTLNAARLAADVEGVPTVLIARTDANSAQLLTSDIDERDHDFMTGERTSEGFFRITGGLECAIKRGLSYAPYADLLWCETSAPDLGEAREFAEAIHAEYPHKMLSYNCFHVGTEFITNDGVKSFRDFKDGDSVHVLTHRGNWKNAIIKNYGKQKLQKIIFKKGDSKEHEIVSTPNHRWILHNGRDTTNIKVGDRVMHAPENYHFDFDSSDLFEKLYWCYGYVYGDGTKWKKNGKYEGSHVRLCKRDARYRSRFEEMGFTTSTNLSLEGDFYAYTGSYLKTLPDLEKDDVNLIKAFVNGLLSADGAKVTNGNGFRFKSIQVTGEESINFLLKALPMCGFYITRIDDYTGQETNFGIRTDITKRINISYCKKKHNKYWSVDRIEEYGDDEVWCLEVEDDKSFVLPMGISTGNCSPSFNWKKNLDENVIAKFQEELGTMGYKFQFITLCGFHSLNYHMFEIARGYKDRGMPAYVELQEQEFAAEEHGYTATKHQREVGTGYYDQVQNVITGGEGSTLALQGSTESEQF